LVVVVAGSLADEFERAGADDHETSWDDQYMRMAVVFETRDVRVT
jgi:hypothetical protein